MPDVETVEVEDIASYLEGEGIIDEDSNILAWPADVDRESLFTHLVRSRDGGGVYVWQGGDIYQVSIGEKQVEQDRFEELIDQAASCVGLREFLGTAPETKEGYMYDLFTRGPKYDGFDGIGSMGIPEPDLEFTRPVRNYIKGLKAQDAGLYWRVVEKEVVPSDDATNYIRRLNNMYERSARGIAEDGALLAKMEPNNDDTITVKGIDDEEDYPRLIEFCVHPYFNDYRTVRDNSTGDKFLLAQDPKEKYRD